MNKGAKKFVNVLCLMLLGGLLSMPGLAACPAGAATTQDAGKLESYWLVDNYPPDGFQVKMYGVTYDTADTDGTMVVASGLVIIPEPPTGKYALVSFQHGTIFTRDQAPSYPEKCVYTQFLREFAGQRYLISMPHDIGMGYSMVIHPFTLTRIPKPLPAWTCSGPPRPCVPCSGEFNGKLFLTGYSQGGRATMALHRLIEERLFRRVSHHRLGPRGRPL